MMIKSTTIIFSLICFLTTLGALHAQQMWPGDVDNNGRVGAVDLLYFGHAFGTEGEERFNMNDISWSPMNMGQMWSETFPDNTNYAYADVSGNGRVDEKDYEAITAFQGLTHGEISDDLMLQPDTAAALPRLTIVPTSYVVRADGTYLGADVILAGNEGNNLVSDVYGLAIRMRFVPGTIRQGPMDASVPSDSWVSGPGETVYPMGFLDSLNGVMEIGFTRRDHLDRAGRGRVMQIYFPVAEGLDLNELSSIGLQIEAAVLVDAELNGGPVFVTSSAIVVDGNCPFTVNPVCGIDGVTYLNSCFAEAAGITFYTPGACYGPGIDVTAMDSTIDCGMEYEPVCGFNAVTYANDCAADAAGVQSYTSGVCPPNDQSCYDPNLIVVSSATTVNTFTGVITVNCPTSGAAVLGCDGNTYPNACLAEASGVRSYTEIGDGGSDCIDPNNIDSDADCGDEQAFVCACTGTTYINACYAEAAGITSYSQGPCGGSSQICDEAVTITCGDYLPNETTIGAGNQITGYPGCTNTYMQGPDRVYVFQKTGAGDLQIGLEIMTPGLDLDIFLLSGDCNDLYCLGSSTTSNTITNNEGIVLEDAPVGTYYIVVDQQHAGVGGNFRLEVSCGYLDCSNSVPLDCGVPYSGTNLNGNDDVSLYTCGNTLNVENNGPEIVHTFNVSETGSVTINLTGLSDNLELFLLSSCDRGEGLAYSQNPGTSNEQITRTLPEGTYYVVVDGYNGAISDYTLTVDCNQTCGLTLQPTGTTDANCGVSNGVYNFSVYGGSPTYIATYYGPVSGSAVSNTGHFCFINLPAGTYTYTVQDGAGCQITSTFVIGDQGDLDVYLNPISAGCGTEGSIGVNVSGSTPPFTVVLSGPETLVQTVNSNNFTLNNLVAGTYTVSVTNGSGCSATSTTTIGQGNGNLSFTATPYPAGCGNPGRIHVMVENGLPNFIVQISGTANGSAEVDIDNFNIINLNPGVYHVTITDASGCSAQQTVVVGNGELDVQVSTTPATCGNPGSALVSVNSGTPPYTVNYFGPSSGTVTTSSNAIVINDLLSGVYTFSVWDANGCDVSETAYVGSTGGNIDLQISQPSGDCSGTSAPVNFNITGGTPSYTLSYSGPTSGTVVINGGGISSLELLPGNYTFIVTDFAGCSTIENYTVVTPQSGLDVTATLTGNGCGQLQNITTTINGGSAPFTVNVANSCGLPVEHFITFNTQFTLDNLNNCTYTVTVTDGNGCSGSDQVTVTNAGDADLLTLVPVDGACDGLGYIDVFVNGGDDPYYIEWTGPVNGNVALISPSYRIDDLPAGQYTVTILTNDGCTDEATATVNSSGNLDLISTLVFADCGQYDQIWNDIIGGTPPFTVEVLRICDSTLTTTTTNMDGFELTDLIPCDYKIKVTDANGCMTMNTVTVFPYQLFDAIPTSGLCGQPGEIEINIMNAASSPPYQVVFSGPQSGSFTLNGNNTTLSNLAAGTYTFTITDANGCAETETVTIIDNPSDLDLQVAVIFGECGQYDQLWNDINGGVPPFTVEVFRLCTNTLDTTFVTNGTSFELTNLEACDYKVKVTDANGCMDMETRTIESSEPDIFNATAVSGPCGQLGRIDVTITGGTAPYQFTYTGPQSGSSTINTSSISLNDLPAGVYTLTMTDANGCSETETVTVVVTNGDIVINSALILNDCGQYNQIWNDIIGGTPPFNIEVLRLCDSTQYADFTIFEPAFELPDLPPCTYKIIVMDAAGCMTMDTVIVYPSTVNIFDLDPFNGDCNELGGFTVDFIGGTPPFEIQYTGPVSDTVVVSDSLDYTVTDLPSGTYTVIVTDSLGCIETEQTTIVNTTTDLELVTAVIFNDCGQYNQLWNDIVGGVPPYTVELIRLCDNTLDTTFTTNDLAFEFPNLPPCTYKVKVTDAAGCMAMTTSNISSTNADLFDVNVGTDCANPSVTINFTDGSAPYTVMLMSADGELNFTDVSGPTFVINQVPPGDYMLMVTSDEGCSELDFINVDTGGSGSLPMAGFTFTTMGTSVILNNTSTNADSFSWDFGDESGITSTEASPTYNYGVPGVYTVCLSATNECGTVDLCQEVTITVGSVVMLDIGEISGEQNEVVSVPVTINGAPNLASLAGSFVFGTPGFGEIVGITPALITPNFNVANQSFSFFSSSPNGEWMAPGLDNLLFYLNVRIDASSGYSDIMFANQPVPMEMSFVNGDGFPQLMSPAQQQGRVTAMEIDIVVFEAEGEDINGQPINNVMFELAPADGSNLVNVASGADGVANLGMQQINQMYYLNASKEGVPGNGLSTFGLYVGQRYILGLPAPQITSPYQVIAGDVNCNGSFTTLDLLLIQRLILGQIDEVPNCEEWVFVHESTEFPTDWNLTNVFNYQEEAAIQLMHDTMTQFVGVRRGDILGFADPSGYNGQDAEARSLNDLLLTADLTAVNAGETFTLQLHSDQLEELVSLQFALAFDADKFRFLGQASDSGLPGLLLSDRLAERGELGISWFPTSGRGLDHASGTVLELQFEALTQVNEFGAEDFEVAASTITAMAHRSDLEQLQPVIEVNTLPSTVVNTTTTVGFRVHQNQPNPLNSLTAVRVELPTEGQLVLIVTDAQGRQVMTRKQEYPAGSHLLNLDLGHLAPGLYHYQVRFGEYFSSLPMLIQR